jgi:hypothetical protein
MTDNPSLGITQADANALNRPNASLEKLIAVWGQDPRYSMHVDGLQETIDRLNLYRQMVIDYLVVQGT